MKTDAYNLTVLVVGFFGVGSGEIVVVLLIAMLIGSAALFDRSRRGRHPAQPPVIGADSTARGTDSLATSGKSGCGMIVAVALMIAALAGLAFLVNDFWKSLSDSDRAPPPAADSAAREFAEALRLSRGNIEEQKAGWELLRSAADHGDTNAQALLGQDYVLPEGTKRIHTKNDQEGLRLLHLAAEKGNALASSALGDYYKQKSDDVEAEKWYIAAAQHNEVFSDSFDPFAVNNSSVPSAATKSLRMAMRTLVTHARRQLGDLSAARSDFRNAALWYGAAASEGDTQSQLVLADMYYRGNGVLQDFDLALMWVNISCTLGNENAQMARYTWNQEGHVFYPKEEAEKILAHIYAVQAH